MMDETGHKVLFILIYPDGHQVIIYTNGMVTGIPEDTIAINYYPSCAMTELADAKESAK